MKTIVFCHGIPGSEADVALLPKPHGDDKLNIIPLHLLDLDAKSIDEGILEAFDHVKSADSSNRIHVVGFSIGAMAAIKIAAARPAAVDRLTLISPAAPLSLGDFLPSMAGRPVFELAIRCPGLLWLLTGLQGLVARMIPRALLFMLFAKAGPIEKQLLQDERFQRILKEAFARSFVERRDTYLAYLNAYVADWSGVLSGVVCPTSLWHGTRDTWAPPEMSTALKHLLGGDATIHEIHDAEHYSTLIQVEL